MVKEQKNDDRENLLSQPHELFCFDLLQINVYIHNLIDRITHTTTFATPLVNHSFHHMSPIC